MADIVRIAIKGSSGYGPFDEAYTDKVTITCNSIAYQYTPCVESDINPKRKWSYKTTSPLFKLEFDRIIVLLSSALEKEPEDLCKDIGGIEFNITYSDKTKLQKTYWTDGDFFKEPFAAIKALIPETEYVPAVLLTSDDYTD